MNVRYALVDCNNFFVSCERIFRPDLELRPVAVLSNNDGCVVARSNEVKALGVPMGVPLFKIKPTVRDNGVELFSANFELYGDISQRIVQVLRTVTPRVEVYSIDESFLEVEQLHVKDWAAWARELRERVWREIGVPVSIGLGPTKTLAKVASTYAKTHGDGVSVVDSEATRRQLLGDLPVEEVWGIGWRTAPKLSEAGISTALSLAEAPDGWLRQQFSITGLKTIDELRGIPRLSFGDKSEQRKTIVRSRSFGHRVRDYYQLESAVATFAARAAAKLRAQGSVCGGVVTSISTGSHAAQVRRASHKVTLAEMTADTGHLIAAALEGLMRIYDDGFAYQKAGVEFVDIVDESAWQLALLDPDINRQGRQRLMSEMDRLNKKFGAGTLWHASEKAANQSWQSKRERRSPRYTTQLSELPVLKWR